MATFQIPILGHATNLDASGNVFFQPYTSYDAAAVFDPQVLIFKDTATKIGLRGLFTIPQNYVSGAKLRVIWNANDGTTDSVVWDFSYLTRSGTEDMGAAAQSTTDTVTDANTGTAFQRQEAEIALGDNFAAGDQVLFELFRDGADAPDTMAADAIVFEVLFEYDDE